MLRLVKDIEVNTLSVISKDSTSVHLGVTIKGHYTNLNLRLDRKHPVLCGFPMDWGLHDLDDPDYEDSVVYITEEDEADIMRLALKAIRRQLRKLEWAGHCNIDRKIYLRGLG